MGERVSRGGGGEVGAEGSDNGQVSRALVPAWARGACRSSPSLNWIWQGCRGPSRQSPPLPPHPILVDTVRVDSSFS